MNKLGFLIAGSVLPLLATVASPVQAFPSSQSNCGGLLESLRTVRPQQLKDVGPDTKVNTSPICEGEQLMSFGNAAGLTHTIGANPALVMALKKAGYRPDEVVGDLVGDSGFVLLYVHHEGGAPKQQQLKISDRRLKTDVRPLETLANGIRLYSFRYLGGSDTFVGVMAQDLLSDARFSFAVQMLPSGYYAVDYDALGLSHLVTPSMQLEGDSVLELVIREAA